MQSGEVLPARTQADLSPSAQTRTRASTARVVCQTQQPCKHVNFIKTSTRSSLMSNLRAAVHHKHTIAVNDGVQAMRNSEHLHPEHNKHECKHPSIAWLASYRALDKACANRLLDQQVCNAVHIRGGLVKHKNAVLPVQQHFA